MKWTDPGWTWPVPIAADGRKPRISDGFHRAGDRAFRNGVGHRGQDIMYRKPLPTAPRHPWSSRWHEMLPRTPALAAQLGVVLKCGKLSTGFHVILDHGSALGTAYHHLSELGPGVVPGALLQPGQVLGVVGGSPVGFGLCHLHFDVAEGGRFFDAAKLMARWRYVSLEAAWGVHGRVDAPPLSSP